MSLTALVLAGVRPGGDPLADFAGVSHKALIPIGGVAMLNRVIAALKESGLVDRIVVSIDRPEIVTAEGVEVVRSASSVSASVGEAFRTYGAPMLVTTADHALLEPEWLRHFVSALPDEAIVAAALARSEVVMAETPDTKRTFLRFRDGAFSGCNLFYLRDMGAMRAVEAWRAFETDRKKPLRLLMRLGPGAVLAHLTGRLTLGAAVKRLEAIAGVRAAAVEMPFGRAAIDVDKPSDLVLVRRLVEGA